MNPEMHSPCCSRAITDPDCKKSSLTKLPTASYNYKLSGKGTVRALQASFPNTKTKQRGVLYAC
ncbi:hypothetical protein KSF_028470 [Reticulibacter mediterranei]|uniref:Uncharacterized protein n=1 Tax=Reticulibacter mediterranei TaxID=2778369 RepID=A0A8J3MZ63_9CHLR|nr:hypothetical protein KSF_028470 [Reticulibacter mediterranei]